MKNFNPQIRNTIFKTFTYAALAAPVFYLLVIFPFFIATKLYIYASDYTAFLTGGQLLLSGDGENLYDLYKQISTQKEAIALRGGIILPYKYFPFLAVLFAPLAKLSVETGYYVFYFFNSILLFLSALLLARFFQFKKLTAMTLVFFFVPTMTSIGVGQISIINLLIILATIFSLKKGLYIESGFFFSFLMQKPNYILMLPFLLVAGKDKVKLLKGFLAGIGLQLLISLTFINPDTLLAYPMLLLHTESEIFGSNVYIMNSFVAFLLKLGIGVGNHSLAYLLNGLLYLFLFLYFAKKRNLDFDRKISTAILFFSATSFHSWPHHLVILLIPIFVTAKIIVKERSVKRKRFLTLLLSVFYILTLPFFPYLSFLTPIILIIWGMYLSGIWLKKP